MKTNTKLRHFLRELETAQAAALLLDYDGTLAPFTVIRDQALPYSGVPELLAAITRETETRLIIISGRAIDDLLPLLDLSPQPEVWGCHGWERLKADGKRTLFPLPERSAAGLHVALTALEKEALEIYCEVKPASVAIHWRGLEDAMVGRLRSQTLKHWKPVAMKYELEIHPFNGGLELRCPGQDKGTALNTILQSIRATTPVAFLGDDMTDEDAFTVIRNRGLGILVNSIPRETNAQFQIKPPEGLIEFLSLWRDKAPGKKGADGRYQ